MVELGAMIRAGSVRISELDARTWQLAETAYAAYHGARAAAEEAERKRKEAVRAATRTALERRS